MTIPSSPTTMPAKMGKYELRREIGRGTMGVVYEAMDPHIGRSVAVKVAISDPLTSPESNKRFRQMFFNEAHTAGLLRHPNILDIFDAGVDQGKCYIVMELIESAETLRAYCRPDNLLPVNQVAEILFLSTKALDYAHRQGVVHRDIKPSNILLTRALDVKIADFSIAHINRRDLAHTLPLGFVGSPRYMSPEQIQEDLVSGRSDLFSLGIVAYELLTGRHPFGAESFSRLMHCVINEDPTPLAQYRPELPAALGRMLVKVLEKMPERRYSTGLDWALDLSIMFSHLQRPQANISARERFDSLKRVTLFRGFSESELGEIVRASLWQEIPQGGAVVREGEIDDAMYLIRAGEARVSKQGHLVQYLTAGDFFGEMSFLQKGRRSATVSAETPLSLMKINATLLEQVTPASQIQFYKMFTGVLIERLAATTDKLSAR